MIQACSKCQSHISHINTYMVLMEDTTLLPPTICVQLEDELCINGANRSGGRRRFRLNRRGGGVGSVTVFSLVWRISTIDSQSSSFASLSSGTLLAT